MYPTQRTQKGFVMLYIAIILSSVVLTIAMAASLSGLFTGNRTRYSNNDIQARMIAMTCAETLLMQVRNSPSLITSATTPIADGSCTYSISGNVPTKTIMLTATRANIYKRITITTSQINPVILSNWVEKAN
jgi:hypothetical protein